MTVTTTETSEWLETKEFPATRTGALEFLQAMGVEAPHVWYNLLGVAGAMREVYSDPRYDGGAPPVGELLEAAEWWRQEPLDVLIPALPDQHGDYWATITDNLPGGGTVLVDTFPLFKGLVSSGLPDFVVQGVLEARGYADAAESSVSPPPVALHAGDTQQYAPVNIIREVLPEGELS